MSINLKKLRGNSKQAALSALYAAAEKFTTNKPVVSFIDELLTEGERVTIGRRILVAQLILSGYTYTEINEILDISPNTYAKVRKWLSSQIPEYNLVVKEQKNITKKNLKKNTNKKLSYNPTTFQGIRNKYPMHFLFFNLAEEILSKLKK